MKTATQLLDVFIGTAAGLLLVAWGLVVILCLAVPVLIAGLVGDRKKVAEWLVRRVRVAVRRPPPIPTSRGAFPKKKAMEGPR